MKQVQVMLEGQLAPVYQGQLDDTGAREVSKALERGEGVTLPLGNGSWLTYGGALMAKATVIVQEAPPAEVPPELQPGLAND